MESAEYNAAAPSAFPTEAAAVENVPAASPRYDPAELALSLAKSVTTSGGSRALASWAGKHHNHYGRMV